MNYSIKIKINNLKKIRKKINTKKKFDRMLEILSERVMNNESISDNAMLDGLIIGFMFSTGDFARNLFLDQEMGRVLDGTLQKLEKITIWTMNNEDELCDILSEIN